MRRAVILVLAAAVAAGAVVVWRFGPGAEFRLPVRMRIEDVVADLAIPGTVGSLAPSDETSVNGGARRAVLAPPPSDLRVRARVPADARLRIVFGIARSEPRVANGASVRFAVSADGRELFAREVDPGRKRDRGWLTHDVDLAALAGQDVELVLATRSAGVPAGTAGWSQVRLVREERRDRQSASALGPNVLVLLVDTLRADRLGCYGARPSPTPNLDRLAATGIVFENAVAQSSWTVPSVASLFTGLHPRSHGVWGAPHDAPDEGTESSYLPDSLPVVARAAQDAGITTFGASANPLVSRGTNFARGFETFVEFGLEHRFGDAARRRNWARAADLDAKLLAWLARNRAHRFFAYVQYMEPHDPYTPPDPPPAPAGVRPAIARGEVWPAAQKLNWHGGPPLPDVELGYLRQLYDGEIRAWDAELGALLSALERLGLRDTTVVIVTADHGEEFQEHGALRHGVDLYDETIRVPLVVAGPGIAPGRVETQAEGIDLFPTVAALLGFAPPPAAPGRNVLAPREPRPAFSELGGGLVAVRAQRWKLIGKPSDGAWRLYDLATDPGERVDRFAAASEGRVLEEQLARWRDTAPAPPAAPTGQDPQLVEKLRALGYVDR